MRVTDSSPVTVPHRQCRCAVSQRIDAERGLGSVQARIYNLRLMSTSMQTLRHAPPQAASPLRQVVTGSSSARHDRATQAMGSRGLAAGRKRQEKRTHAWKVRSSSGTGRKVHKFGGQKRMDQWCRAERTPSKSRRHCHQLASRPRPAAWDRDTRRRDSRRLGHWTRALSPPDTPRQHVDQTRHGTRAPRVIIQNTVASKPSRLPVIDNGAAAS